LCEDDPTTCRMFKEILATEEEHAEELAEYLKAI
jgi:bacterioferritin (cytochrome b1)